MSKSNQARLNSSDKNETSLNFEGVGRREGAGEKDEDEGREKKNAYELSKVQPS